MSAFTQVAIERHDLQVARGAYSLATAFASEFGGPKESPCVAILAEYDALPEIGHACGHNLIATAGLGAALALAKIGDPHARPRALYLWIHVMAH